MAYRSDLVRNASALKKVRNPLNGGGDAKEEFKNKTGFQDLNEQENAIATGAADWKGHKAGHSLNKVKKKYLSMVNKP